MVSVRDLGLAVTRSAHLLVRRRTPCLVTPLPGGGWRHRYRQGVLVSPTPRGATWRLSEQYTADVFLHRHTPRPGDVVVDIGAGWGTEVVTFSRLVGPTGRVIAVEAHPGTCDLLRRTCTDNGLTNVTVVQAAIADEVGELSISDLEDQDAISNTVMAEGTGRTVPALTIDALVERVGVDRIDLLKMNIEGAERLAVRGMEVSAASVRHLVVSCHDFRSDLGDGEVFRTRDEVSAALGRLGFTLTSRPDDPRPWVRGYLYGAAGSMNSAT